MQNESQNTEYKESWHDEYLKWICGFANAQGGIIYIGVNDAKAVVGVKNAKKLMEDIPNMTKDRLGIIVDVNLLSEVDKEYIEIRVAPSSNPISLRGKYYYRTGSTLQELRGTSLDSFILSKQGRTWDGVPLPNLSIDYLDRDAIKTFQKEAVRSQRMSSDDVNVSTEELLEKLHLVEDDNLKRAAAMLFHPDPEKFVTGAFVKVGYFLNDADLVYQDEIHGSLFRQVASTMDLLTTKYTKATIRYEGIQRIDEQPLPVEGLREAVLNAIVHKAYGVFAPIQISVYDNRIMIWNPGYLPQGWTIDTLTKKHGSSPFNPDIANVFFRAGYIESWGRGIEKIRQACEKYGCPQPEWQYDGTGLWTTLWFKAEPSDKPSDAISSNLSDVTIKLLQLMGKTMLGTVAHSVGTVDDSRVENGVKCYETAYNDNSPNNDTESKIGGVGTVSDNFGTVAHSVGTVDGAAAKVEAAYTKQLSALADILYQNPDKEWRTSALLELLPRISKRKLLRDFISPLIDANVIERTIPDKPNSSKQGYRLTPMGRKLFKL